MSSDYGTAGTASATQPLAGAPQLAAAALRRGRGIAIDAPDFVALDTDSALPLRVVCGGSRDDVFGGSVAERGVLVVVNGETGAVSASPLIHGAYPPRRPAPGFEGGGRPEDPTIRAARVLSVDARSRVA